MQNFTGIIEYLSLWTWGETEETITTADGFSIAVDALPFIVDDHGKIHTLSVHKPGVAVFLDDAHVYKYLVTAASRDLQYRGFREDRVTCFSYKQEALFLLLRRLKMCTDSHEYEALR